MEQMLVNDGQAHRGFRKNIFNDTLTIVGISCWKHPAGSIAQFEYAKGLLKEGQTQQINVTVTDEVPDELIDKMKSLGIDTKRIQFNRKNEKQIAKSAAGPAVTDSGGKSAQRRQYQVETTSIENAQSHIKKQFTRNKQFIPEVKMKGSNQPLSKQDTQNSSTTNFKRRQTVMLQKSDTLAIPAAR